MDGTEEIIAEITQWCCYKQVSMKENNNDDDEIVYRRICRENVKDVLRAQMKMDVRQNIKSCKL